MCRLKYIYRTMLKIGLFTSIFFTSFIINAEIAVIVHPSNNANLDKNSIERIFMGKKKSFDNGNATLPLNASKSMATRDEFNQHVIGRSSSQVNAYWSKLVFTGKGTMPKELSSDAEIVALIASNKDAISYITSSAVTDAVKVIAKY